MKRIYFDNAASTPLHPEVVTAMTDAMDSFFGNPSSIHAFGRESKSIIENSRKMIAHTLNCQSNEIIFTSGGTEANNLIIRSFVENLGIQRIITQPLEHKSVLETCLEMAKKHQVVLEMLPVNHQGNINISDLEKTLENSSLKTLVTLIHGNNEIGNLIDLQKITLICHQYNAYFHSDTVQTIGHYLFDITTLNIDAMSCAAHKFHGPKGNGFAFIKKSLGLKPILTGGGQERSMRSGTENIYGIAGMSKAFQMAYQNLESYRTKLVELKQYCIEKLKKNIDNVAFAGLSDNNNSLYTLVNAGIPVKNSMLSFELDLKNIAVSQGSACNSGATKLSHVLASVLTDEQKETYTFIRISFSIYNTFEEIDILVNELKNIVSRN